MPLYNPIIPRIYETTAMPGAIAETCHRYTASASSTPTGGTLYINSLGLTLGQTVGHIGFCTGTTPTTAASHSWVALLDNTYKQLAHSADGTTTNLAASTWFNLAVTAPYTATYTGQYYLAILITVSAGNVANIVSPTFTPAAQFVTGASVPTPLLNGTSTTGLTVPGTDGTTTYAAPTAVGPTFYMYAAA